jgi:hypothetical protein
VKSSTKLRAMAGRGGIVAISYALRADCRDDQRSRAADRGGGTNPGARPAAAARHRAPEITYGSFG